MLRTKREIITKLHLVISVLIVIPVAVIYGFYPELFDLSAQTPNDHNFHKAVMGVYVGFSVFWMFGIAKNAYLKLAVITHIVFMIGLGFGRAISMCIDGAPTWIYIFGMFAELGIGAYGMWVLRRFLGTDIIK